jgi:hypothetical protein
MSIRRPDAATITTANTAISVHIMVPPLSEGLPRTRDDGNSGLLRGRKGRVTPAADMRGLLLFHQCEFAVTDPGEVSASYKGKRIAEMISICLLGLTFLLTYVLWEHKNDAKENLSQLTAAITEMTKAQRSGDEEQREMNCLIA